MFFILLLGNQQIYLFICSVMIFAVVCVMGGIVKDWVEFCKDLVDEE